MVLGTIWQNPMCSANFERDIRNLRKATDFDKEFHWTEMKRHQTPAYMGLVELFKEYMDQGLMTFRALVVDESDQTHKIYSNSKELHFYKMFFWLINKRLRPQNRYDVYLDQKSNSVPGRLTDLREALNNKCKKDKLTTDNLVRRVEARDGSQAELQLADVFAGAIAYVRNGHFNKATSPRNPKVLLVNHIQEYLDLTLDKCHSPWENPGFNIWCFKRNGI